MRPSESFRSAVVTWLGYGGLLPFVGTALLEKSMPRGALSA